MRNADLLKGFLVRLRTRPASTTFRWAKDHDDNYGNQRVDALANEGREAEWPNEHPALQDGVRLQALEASHMYYKLLKWHTRKVIPVLHQERLEEVKDKVDDRFTPHERKLLTGPRIPTLREFAPVCRNI